MTVPESPRPSFLRPPLVEVALSIQFEPLTDFRTPHLGLLWKEFGDRFRHVEEHAPLPHVVESLGAPAPFRLEFELRTFDVPPMPRCWFLNEAGSEVIQVQQDRLIHNWRKVEGGTEYPHFTPLRARFQDELATFRRFVAREGLGEVLADQCEVNYVDEIHSGEGWDSHSQADRVFTTWSSRYSDDVLPQPEDVRFGIRYLIPEPGGGDAPVGRLHINVEPAFTQEGNQPIFIIRTTARGMPLGDDDDGVLRFMDLGHNWATRGFAAITTEQMHERWGRQR